MAFWALGAFDKLKNISIEKVTKKVKDYVVTPYLFSTLLCSKIRQNPNSNNKSPE